MRGCRYLVLKLCVDSFERVIVPYVRYYAPSGLELSNHCDLSFNPVISARCLFSYFFFPKEHYRTSIHEVYLFSLYNL